MTGGLVHPTSLEWPFMAEAIAMTVGFLVSFVMYWISRNMQQKVAILNSAGALCAAVGMWILFCNEAIWERPDGVRAFWGRWLAYAASCGFITASLGTTLIMHDWAKIVFIVAGVALPLDAMLISLAASNGAQIVLAVFGLLAFFFMLYLLTINVVRKDWFGWVVIIFGTLDVLAVGLVLLLGPEFLGGQLSSLSGFTDSTYAWVLFALAAMFIVLLPILTWFFVEDERVYRARKGLPEDKHASTGDGVNLALLPGSHVNGSVNGASHV